MQPRLAYSALFSAVGFMSFETARGLIVAAISREREREAERGRERENEAEAVGAAA